MAIPLDILASLIGRSQFESVILLLLIYVIKDYVQFQSNFLRLSRTLINRYIFHRKIYNGIFILQQKIMAQKPNTELIEDHILKKYDIKEKVGSGAYGHVWRVEHKKTKIIYALKKIFDAFQNATDAQRTYRQITVLKQLDNPTIIKLHKVIKAENQKDIYLVFEYMESDLHSVIRQNILLEQHKKYVIYQLAKSLKYIHSAELIHRDLKPSNVLINEECTVKICDFGLVRILSKKFQEDYVLTEYVATRWYRSPEVLLGSQNYNKSTDMWSLGCIIAQMMIGRPLFPGKSTIDQLQKILTFTGYPNQEQLASIQCPDIENVLKEIKFRQRHLKDWFRDVDPAAVDLIIKLLQFNPNKRISIKEVLKHPYVAQYRMESEEVNCLVPVECDINDNKKLSVKEYRNLIYNSIAPEKVLRFKKSEGIFRIKKDSFTNTIENDKMNQSKSSWISPYVKESRVMGYNHYKKIIAVKPKQEVISSHMNNSLNKQNIENNTATVVMQQNMRKNILKMGKSTLKKKNLRTKIE